MSHEGHKLRAGEVVGSQPGAERIQQGDQELSVLIGDRDAESKEASAPPASPGMGTEQAILYDDKTPGLTFARQRPGLAEQDEIAPMLVEPGP